MVLLGVGFALLAKRLSVGVKATKSAHEVCLCNAQALPPRAERRSVRRFFGAKTPVAPAGLNVRKPTASRPPHLA
jgi:hypothetical protein